MLRIYRGLNVENGLRERKKKTPPKLILIDRTCPN